MVQIDRRKCLPKPLTFLADRAILLGLGRSVQPTLNGAHLEGPPISERAPEATKAAVIVHGISSGPQPLTPPHVVPRSKVSSGKIHERGSTVRRASATRRLCRPAIQFAKGKRSSPDPGRGHRTGAGTKPERDAAGRAGPAHQSRRTRQVALPLSTRIQEPLF
jgi:hypothetical protein